MRSRVLYLFEGETREAAENAWAGVGEMVRAYMIGSTSCSGLVLSVASGLLFASVKSPYWLVAAPISGFLSLVPYIGLPLAMVPPIIAALPATRIRTLLVSRAQKRLALLHLLALNLRASNSSAPGEHQSFGGDDRVDVLGLLWGGIGLLLAIPLTASIKAVCDHLNGLQAYGRLLGD